MINTLKVIRLFTYINQKTRVYWINKYQKSTKQWINLFIDRKLFIDREQRQSVVNFLSLNFFFNTEDIR